MDGSVRLGAYAARWPSGILASTLLISCCEKPVTVLLCFGRVIPGGPTGSWKSVIGAEVDGLLSRVLVVDAMFGECITSFSAHQVYVLPPHRCT